MHIAYLVTEYPKVSHTFVRREIAALEQSGAQVERITLRPCPDDLVDPLDRDEATRTRSILAGGGARLAGALCLTALLRPLRFLRALALTLEIGARSERGVLRHLAYLAEACVLLGWTRGVSHVHAHFGTNSTAVAMLCHALGGPGYSFTVHGPDEFDTAKLISLGEKILRARFVVAISSYGRSQLYRLVPFEHWGKIHIVRCGLDADFLEAEPTPIADTAKLVSVGRLSGQKGQLLLIDAIAEVVGRGAKLSLTLVGDGEMRGEVEAAIRRHGLQERVTITGWASSDEVREQLRSARALVLPSFAEGLPVVIMEALALGRPALTTYVAGIPELVEPGQCGWLVPAGSVPALAAALEQVLAATPAELQRLGSEGRRRVLERHDVRKEARALLDLFERYASS